MHSIKSYIHTEHTIGSLNDTCKYARERFSNTVGARRQIKVETASLRRYNFVTRTEQSVWQEKINNSVRLSNGEICPNKTVVFCFY